ncbi:MAG: alpha/beta fold hydrolase [Candidatus Acidiferrales bacterium]
MPTPLLFLPGLACDADVWQDQVRAFSKITTVWVADYGLSDSIEKMAAVALDGAPERFAIAGHSMGGRVAFEIVRRAPERVTGIALLNTAYRAFAGGEAGERETAARFALLELARTKGMRAMAEYWIPNIIHPDRVADKAFVSAIIAMMGRKSPEIFAAQIKALLGRPDATPVLPSIRCPTMVLCGREDAWSPLAAHREMVAMIPGSKLAVIEHCGHMAPMERPEDVTAALSAWFSGLS